MLTRRRYCPTLHHLRLRRHPHRLAPKRGLSSRRSLQLELRLPRSLLMGAKMTLPFIEEGPGEPGPLRLDKRGAVIVVHLS